MLKYFILTLSSLILLSCASSPLDRRQVVLYSDAEMARQGEQAYRQMQQELPVTSSSRETNYAQCVANHVIQALDDSDRNSAVWEVTVFDADQANAFALPGGKIGVYNGLFDTAVNQDQLAAVLAHEVGHVLADHSNERASQSTIRNVGIAAAQIFGVSNTTVQLVDKATELGLFLPFNRTQESEADRIGIMLMANAGFEPAASITLWENMSVDSGPRPPEILSTHPSPSSRMQVLQSLVPEAENLLAAARARGLRPDCSR
ncbi:MAG: M48 family metallopeptidase [Pseudohongiellaceae bacterium]